MDRRGRAPAATEVVGHGVDADDEEEEEELGVFAAERYFYGDDDAVWCERSSSSLSSSAFRTAGTLEHDRSVVPTPTAGTTSSEASWNSRSALLPRYNDPPEPPPAAKLRVGAATPVAAAEPVVSGAESDERAGRRRRASSSSSSSNLRRWLLGVVTGCACGGGDGEESVASADEMKDSCDVHGVGGEKCNTAVASDLSPRRTEMVVQELAFEEPTVVTVRPGSGRWLLEEDEFVLAGRESFCATEIAGGHGHRRSTNSGEMSMPLVYQPDATSRRRTKSLEMLRPLGDDERGNAFSSATQSSGFTIVAGNGHAPPRASAGGGGGRSPGAGGEEDDAASAASEVGWSSAYPPSEASVVWSVVTADGAASAGNFSSAASGYYHHHYYFNSYGGEDGAAKGDRRRRSGITTASSLLACMSDKAVDAVGPVHRPEVESAAMARLGAAGGSRNGRGGGYQQDVMRRRVGW